MAGEARDSCRVRCAGMCRLLCYKPCCEVGHVRRAVHALPFSDLHPLLMALPGTEFDGGAPEGPHVSYEPRNLVFGKLISIIKLVFIKIVAIRVKLVLRPDHKRRAFRRRSNCGLLQVPKNYDLVMPAHCIARRSSICHERCVCLPSARKPHVLVARAGSQSLIIFTVV